LVPYFLLDLGGNLLPCTVPFGWLPDPAEMEIRSFLFSFLYLSVFFCSSVHLSLTPFHTLVPRSSRPLWISRSASPPFFDLDIPPSFLIADGASSFVSSRNSVPGDCPPPLLGAFPRPPFLRNTRSSFSRYVSGPRFFTRLGGYEKADRVSLSLWALLLIMAYGFRTPLLSGKASVFVVLDNLSNPVVCPATFSPPPLPTMPIFPLLRFPYSDLENLAPHLLCCAVACSLRLADVEERFSSSGQTMHLAYPRNDVLFFPEDGKWRRHFYDSWVRSHLGSRARL